MSTEPANSVQHKKKKKKTASFRANWKIFLCKCIFTMFCLVAFYMLYLDSKIRNKMDGQIWHLPAEVYSRIESIRTENQQSMDEIKQLLLDNGYRQTTMLAAPGDFKIEQNSLVLIRRAFPFPDQAEAQRVFRLRFQQDKLQVIEDLVNQRAIESFRLAPKLIAMLQSENEERLAIALQNYPRLLIDTLLLTEDRRFYEHSGISLIGITRAMLTNLKAGYTVQGGSTITQQLVKNLFLSNDRNLIRKANEALMAVILDWRYDKNRILETYLNEIYLGQSGDIQIHGFELASQFYFGRPIREISLDQIALLVGMVKGPSLYNPWRNPNNAMERRNVVLKLLVDHKVIGQELYEILIKRPLGVQARGQITRNYPAFIQTLQKELRENLAEYKAGTLLGARIFTTLDVNQQRYAEQAVIQGVKALQEKTKNPYLQSAFVVANYHTGEIKALVGGVQTQYAGFNRAVNAQRQIGSLVKPAIYLTALSKPEQFRLNTPIQNQPITIRTKGSPPWQPRNYDRKYSGSVMLMDALVRSLNIPTVNIGMQVGLSEVIATQKKMGWDKIAIPHVPAMLLGSYAISPYDVTKLYQVIANEGYKINLTTVDVVVNRQGKIIYQPNQTGEQVVPQQAAFQTLYTMQQTVERGTGRSLQREFAHLHLAGKTGTTNDARDTWFVGIDGKDVATVWLGRDDNGETKLTGASGALQIYQHYLQQANIKPLKLTTPAEIQWVGINSYGGWDCNSSRTIPVWAKPNQRFCQPQTVNSNTMPNNNDSTPSLWDVLKEKPNVAPVEEAMPAN
ncbi:penicillin-binding protein 1B [Volucribacter amazonae]|uniref:Penicillin-binding protein 1B n=1 Tax=Volucribacter amazonae TaxID=256731 RepID=A0A9X4PED3_9PAST|nr:penicillin-binding protein 1B [Volucribacter amazonae]MDG6895996.1 penicillin-binding protein 1B [Volucribacter amazonae]